MADEEFDKKLRETLVRKGWLMPTTVQEVRVAEEELAKLPPVELPESLRDPYEIIRRHPEVFGPREPEKKEPGRPVTHCCIKRPRVDKKSNAHDDALCGPRPGCAYVTLGRDDQMPETEFPVCTDCAARHIDERHKADDA